LSGILLYSLPTATAGHEASKHHFCGRQFDLILSLRVARTLGLDVPASYAARVDEIIE